MQLSHISKHQQALIHGIFWRESRCGFFHEIFLKNIRSFCDLKSEHMYACVYIYMCIYMFTWDTVVWQSWALQVNTNIFCTLQQHGTYPAQLCRSISTACHIPPKFFQGSCPEGQASSFSRLPLPCGSLDQQNSTIHEYPRYTYPATKICTLKLLLQLLKLLKPIRLIW